MERRVAVHLVLIVVFGQIHSAKIKVEKYSDDYTVGAMVSYGVTDNKHELLGHYKPTSGVFCLKHSQKINLYYPMSPGLTKKTKIYFKIDGNKYHLRKTHEPDLDIDEKKEACFLYGTWIFSWESAITKIEFYFTYLSDVFSIVNRQLLNLNLSFSEGTLKSYIYVNKSEDYLKEDKVSLSILSSKIEALVGKLFKGYDERYYGVIGYVAGFYGRNATIKFKIDSSTFIRSGNGNLNMVFYNKTVDKIKDAEAMINYIKNYSNTYTKNYLAEMKGDEYGFTLKLLYKLPGTDDSEKDNLVSEIEEDEAANIANGFKQHI